MLLADLQVCGSRFRADVLNPLAIELRIVQPSSSSSCLQTAAANHTNPSAYFNFTGSTASCGSGADFDYLPNGEGPYSITDISLDRNFQPYTLSIGNDSQYVWQVPLQTGSRFTVMMK